MISRLRGISPPTILFITPIFRRFAVTIGFAGNHVIIAIFHVPSDDDTSISRHQDVDAAKFRRLSHDILISGVGARRVSLSLPHYFYILPRAPAPIIGHTGVLVTARTALFHHLVEQDGAQPQYIPRRYDFPSRHVAAHVAMRSNTSQDDVFSPCASARDCQHHLLPV